MNRAERRRAAKQVAKGELSVAEMPRSRLMPTAIVASDGKKYTDLEEYLDAMEKRTAKGCGDIAAQLLYDSEIYISAANILIMLFAVKMTFGNLKTVQKQLKNVLKNYNSAADYVDKIGIRKAYDELSTDYGLQMEFDDCDLNWICDEGAEIQKRFKFRIGER